MTPAETPLLRAIQMPTGRPMMMQMNTESPVMMSVSMLSDHSPTTPKKSIERVTRIVDRSPAKTKVTQAAIATTPSQPISGTGRGGAGMLISSWNIRTTESGRRRCAPSTPPMNQLSWPSSCTQSRTSLILRCSSVVSCSPRALVYWPCHAQ